MLERFMYIKVNMSEYIGFFAQNLIQKCPIQLTGLK